MRSLPFLSVFHWSRFLLQMSSAGLHVDTWGKIIQPAWKIHWGLAIRRQALGVTSLNFPTTLIALRPLGWTKKGFPSTTHENSWLEWDSSGLSLIVGPKSILGLQTQKGCGNLQRPGIEGDLCAKMKGSRLEWLNDNRPVQRRFLYLRGSKPLLDPLLFCSIDRVLYILILFIVSGRKLWTKWLQRKLIQQLGSQVSLQSLTVGSIKPRFEFQSHQL